MKSDIKISGIVTGLLIIAAGVLLLLFNNGNLDPAYKHVVFSWPSLVMAVGFTCIFSRCKWIFGLVLMLVGGFFLLRKVDAGGIWAHSQTLWTVLLILPAFMSASISETRICETSISSPLLFVT